MRYPGGIIRGTPVIPTTGSASGVWALTEAMQAQAQGIWPVAEVFAPVDLFAASEVGGLYDPSDPSTLWLDTAGTSPVTSDGDPVARIDDLSGNGNHLTQSTSTARPLYKTDGTLHWIEGDGVDDFLISSSISGWGEGSSIAGGFVSEIVGSDANRYGVFGAGSTYSSSQVDNFVLALRPNSAHLNHLLRMRFGASPSVHISFSPSLDKTSNFALVGMVDNDSLMSAWIDGESRGTNTVDDFTGSTLAAPIRLDGTMEPVMFFGGLLIQRTLTAAEITDVSNFYIEKAGVTA